MHFVRRGSQLSYVDDDLTPGLSAAHLCGRSDGPVHLDIAVGELKPGASERGHLHAFEESVFVLDGGGQFAVADQLFDIGPGSFGLAPIGTPHLLSAGPLGMRWLRVRAPQPLARDGYAGTYPVPDWTADAVARRPLEINPRIRYAGSFAETDMGAYGPLSMPGYHGQNVQSIFVRMLVDELFGAHQHTLFMVEFGPQAVRGNAATEHYHPFEEIYYLLSGAATATLDGAEVEVAAGDLVWTGVNGTHGFVNNGDVPVRWLEVQAPVPPSSHAFFFPKDWDALIIDPNSPD